MTTKVTRKKETETKETSAFPVQAPRGTQDLLPQEQKYWEYVVETAKSVIRGFGFQRLDTPLFEETILFTRSLGEDSDVVNKELFDLKGRGGTSHFSLRPEGTAPIVRAYIEHGMRSWPKPVKLFYIGPFFRYERPQKGRWRQHHQFGAEIFGSTSPFTDAQLIFVMHTLLKDLGLEDYTLRINSLGLPAERKGYLKLLKDHYRRHRQKTCKTCRERLISNPLRVLDCKEEKCQQLINTAPRLIDHLTDASRQHFEAVLNALDQLDVPYDVAPTLVRGLDYYTHTVFEFTSKQRAGVAQSSLISGGRYNGLMKQLGGSDTAAIGAAGGIERIIDQLKEEGVELTITDAPQLFVAHLGEQAKFHALKILHILQQAGIPFAESLDREGMQAQLKVADRLGVPWTIIIGHKEVLDKTVILRSMDSGMQEVVAQEQLVTELQRRLNLLAT